LPRGTWPIRTENNGDSIHRRPRCGMAMDCQRRSVNICYRVTLSEVERCVCEHDAR
jgi:hypothetical protein